MTLRNLVLGAAAAGSLCLATVAAAQTAQPAPGDSSQPAPGAPPAPAPAPVAPSPAPGSDAAGQLSSADQDFIEAAAHAGNAEIEASRLALEKAGSPDVKAFAQKMIDDHTKVAGELKTLAGAKGVTPPDGPSLVQTAKIKALGMLDGDSFDKMYASQIAVSAHEDAVELFRKHAQEGEDAELKAFAQKTLPSLESHLQMGRELKQKVDAKAEQQ